MLCSDGGSRDNRVHRQPSHLIYAGKVHRQPCHVSCILYLGFTALAHHILVLHCHHFLDLRRPPYLGFTPLGHHIMSHLVLISQLVLTMTYSTCSTDAGATSVTSLHDLHQGALTHNHRTHAIGSQIKYTSVLYKYRPGKGINNISFWS